MRAQPPRPRAPPRAAPAHLSNVQILRGVAAVMVLIYHIGNEFEDRGFAGHFPDVGAGSAGVDVFFVLSGFVMAHSTRAAFGQPGAPGLFLARRLVRLVPLYWLVTTVFALRLVWEARATGVPADTWRWVAASYAFLFCPHPGGGDFPLYQQGWTLNYEMFFYAGFAAVLPFGRRIGLTALCLALAAFAALGLAVALPWPADRWSDTIVLEFVLGIGLAAAEARGMRLPLWAAVALPLAALAFFVATIGAADDWLPYRGLVWGPPACAMVAAAALYRPRRGGAARLFLERFGDASYALYLVHYAFFVFLGDAIATRVPVASLPPRLYGAACFLGAIALALLVHRLVERPMTRWLNATFDLPRRWGALADRPVRAGPGDGPNGGRSVEPTGR